MQLILTQDVTHLGRAGDLVTVKQGYGRNYLLPQGLALLATKHRKAEVDHYRTILASKAAENHQKNSSTKERLDGMILQFERKMSDGDAFFGSVTIRDIAKQLEGLEIVVPLSNILLEKPIKEPGQYQVPIRLSVDLEATLKLIVKTTSEASDSTQANPMQS